jgi:hypothetical protein
MLADELADVIVELMLWLLSYIQFDGLGLVVKAAAEERFEFLGLWVCQSINSVPMCFTQTYLVSSS